MVMMMEKIWMELPTIQPMNIIMSTFLRGATARSKYACARGQGDKQGKQHGAT